MQLLNLKILIKENKLPVNVYHKNKELEGSHKSRKRSDFAGKYPIRAVNRRVIFQVKRLCHSGQ